MEDASIMLECGRVGRPVYLDPTALWKPFRVGGCPVEKLLYCLTGASPLREMKRPNCRYRECRLATEANRARER